MSCEFLFENSGGILILNKYKYGNSVVKKQHHLHPLDLFSIAIGKIYQKLLKNKSNLFYN